MRRKKWIAITCILVVVSIPLIAQITIGLTAIDAAAGGLPVHDFGSDLNSTIQRALIVAKQVAQIAIEVEHMGYTFQHLTRFKTEMTGMLFPPLWSVNSVLWRPTVTYSDTYGTNGGWLSGVNKGFTAAAAYLAYVDQLQTQIRYGGQLGGLNRVQRSISALELADGTNARAMQVVGDFRTNQYYMQPGLEDLRHAALDQGSVSEKDIAQKTLIMGSMSAQMQNSQNELLATKLEMDLVQATAQRNAAVRALNDHLYMLDVAPSVLAGQAAGTTEAIRAMSLP